MSSRKELRKLLLRGRFLSRSKRSKKAFFESRPPGMHELNCAAGRKNQGVVNDHSDEVITNDSCVRPVL